MGKEAGVGAEFNGRRSTVWVVCMAEAAADDLTDGFRRGGNGGPARKAERGEAVTENP